MKRRIVAAGLLLAMTLSLAGCGGGGDPVELDPNDPVLLRVWHYYNGAQQGAFDELVRTFNETVGKEQGIYVEGSSQGDVTQLEENVMAALNKEVGAEAVPDIFSSYADTAYAIEKLGFLADISQYLSQEELDTYVDSYIEEGRIGENGELKIFPTAKSSEIFMLNQTDWAVFAQATGAALEDLATNEGLVRTAQRYYEWTDAQTPETANDGKAFYGRDSMANLFIIGSMQLGSEIFQVQDRQVTLQVDQDAMRKIWDFYYVPFVKGYFGAYGRFRSDDVKIGELLAYTGSSTSAMYFPDVVELEDGSYPIDYVVRPAPGFADGEAYAVQQGAGMVVTKTDQRKEYAAVVFLKWFTQETNNIEFGCSSGYLPVKKDAYDQTLLDQVIAEKDLQVPAKTYDTLLTAFDMVKTNTMYTNKAFDGGAAARKVLEYNLSDRAAADRQLVQTRLEEGMTLEEATADLTTDAAFEDWFAGFNTALHQAVAQS